MLKIAELCKEVGENSSTIRHWTKEGILEVSDITKSGYQLYSRDMIDRIKYINLLKEQRFTLKEIKEKLLNNVSI